jgi:hypothetical protein
MIISLPSTAFPVKAVYYGQKIVTILFGFLAIDLYSRFQVQMNLVGGRVQVGAWLAEFLASTAWRHEERNPTSEI